ncbi:hypothetical protein [Shimia sp. MIT910701]|uniref:hypothetical protein n=1 Tax=Shimia sp. MIT910701 TaxID=3096987 RepID=UPI00399B2C50
MSDVKSIVAAVGSEKIQEKTGKSEHSVRAAIRDKLFPAKWYPVIKELCADVGEECPLHLFNFIQSEEAPSSEDAA